MGVGTYNAGIFEIGLYYHHVVIFLLRTFFYYRVDLWRYLFKAAIARTYIYLVTCARIIAGEMLQICRFFTGLSLDIYLMYKFTGRARAEWSDTVECRKSNKLFMQSITETGG